MFVSQLQQSGAKFSLRMIAAVATIPALLVGGTMMYVAWMHNPQCEIHCDGQIDWAYWVFIGVCWAVPVFFLTALTLSIGIRTILQSSYCRRRSDKQF